MKTSVSAGGMLLLNKYCYPANESMHWLQQVI